MIAIYSQFGIRVIYTTMQLSDSRESACVEHKNFFLLLKVCDSWRRCAALDACLLWPTTLPLCRSTLPALPSYWKCLRTSGTGPAPAPSGPSPPYCRKRRTRSPIQLFSALKWSWWVVLSRFRAGNDQVKDCSCFYFVQSIGLVLVHAHSRWVLSQGSDHPMDVIDNDLHLKLTPEIPLWRFYLSRYHAAVIRFHETTNQTPGFISYASVLML